MILSRIYAWLLTFESKSMIKALSYIGIKSTLRNEWATFATKILGMQLIDKGGDTSIFRMDSQAQRFFVSEEHDESIACMMGGRNKS